MRDGPDVDPATAAVVLGGPALLIAAFAGGWFARSPALELLRSQRDGALADLEAERAAHRELAQSIRDYGREERRRRGLADDPGLDPLDFARRVLQPAEDTGEVPAAGEADG